MADGMYSPLTDVPLSSLYTLPFHLEPKVLSAIALVLAGLMSGRSHAVGRYDTGQEYLLDL
jgi:hypothetical protein